MNGAKLIDDAANLEQAVRKDVGVDNIHVDAPPINKIPKWIMKLTTTGPTSGRFKVASSTGGEPVSPP